MDTVTADIGSFHLETGTLIVTDPCYEPNNGCSGIIENAKPGKWQSIIEWGIVSGWGERNWTLIVKHADASKSETAHWRILPFRVSVDSGQAGVFDLARYPSSSKWQGSFEDENSFYGSVCKLTLSDVGAGCINFGAVSSSGLGDGSYSAYSACNEAGETVGVMIVFINEADFYDSEDES